GFTLVDPNPRDRTTDIEFALHDGCPATEWAKAARPGDTIDATVLGTKITWPKPDPSGYLVDGDTASLPAINRLLTGRDGTHERVRLERQPEDDQTLPVAATPHT